MSSYKLVRYSYKSNSMGQEMYARAIFKSVFDVSVQSVVEFFVEKVVQKNRRRLVDVHEKQTRVPNVRVNIDEIHEHSTSGKRNISNSVQNGNQQDQDGYF